MASVRGPNFVVTAAHLEPFDARARARQAQDLRDHIDAFDEEYIVLAGDLNLDPSSAHRGRGTDVVTWSRLSETMHDTGRDAGATTIVGRRIDHVLVRGPMAPAALATDAQVLGALRLPKGDHRPLCVRLPLDHSGPFTDGDVRRGQR